MRTWRKAWEKKGMMSCVILSICHYCFLKWTALSLWELLIVVSLKHTRTSKLGDSLTTALPWEWGCVVFATVYYLSRQTHNTRSITWAKIVQNGGAKTRCKRNESHLNYNCLSLSKDNESEAPDHQEMKSDFFSVALDIPTSTMVLYMVVIYTVIWETLRRGQPAFPHPDVWQVLICIDLGERNFTLHMGHHPGTFITVVINIDDTTQLFPPFSPGTFTTVIINIDDTTQLFPNI